MDDKIYLYEKGKVEVPVHFMKELPEYREIYEKYYAEGRKLDKYREQCNNEAFDMLKEYFYSLWD